MLWKRLTELENSCTVKIESRLERDQLRWKVTIMPAASGSAVIVAEAGEIKDAVAEGIRQAVAAGLLAE